MTPDEDKAPAKEPEKRPRKLPKPQVTTHKKSIDQSKKKDSGKKKRNG
jgi:hypothetical protein